MSVSESQRRQLYTDLERTLGPESASVMMDLMPSGGWADIARQPYVDAQFVALRGEIAELRAEVRGEARHVAAINAVAVMASSITTAGLVLGAFAIAH